MSLFSTKQKFVFVKKNLKMHLFKIHQGKVSSPSHKLLSIRNWKQKAYYCWAQFRDTNGGKVVHCNCIWSVVYDWKVNWEKTIFIFYSSKNYFHLNLTDFVRKADKQQHELECGGRHAPDQAQSDQEAVPGPGSSGLPTVFLLTSFFWEKSKKKTGINLLHFHFPFLF